MEKKKIDKKTIIIIAAIVVVLLIVGIVLFFTLGKNKNNNKTTTTTTAVAEDTVTVTFDSNGGDPIESMIIKKGEQVTLPIATYEGHIFKWWSDDKDITYNEICTFEEDTKLKANWEEVPADAKTVKISFDSKGGSTVKAMTLLCENDAINIKSFPKNPTKDSYMFRAWEDKNGKAILVGAKLTCDDITLYAGWDYDGPTASPNNATNDNKSCPDGFELKDKKCISTKSPEYYCPDGYTNSTVDNTVCYKYLKEPDKVECSDGRFHFTQNSTSGSIMHFCGTEIPRLTGATQECTNEGGVMRDNHCVKDAEPVNNSKLKFTCNNSTYRAGTALGSNAKDGCYDLKQRIYGCKKAGEGYSMNYTTSKCVKTVDATLN